MKTLIVYDNNGLILQRASGEYYLPQGVPYLEVEIPVNKRLKITDGIGVDVSVTPHQAILEDVPPSDIERLRLDMARNNAELFETILMLTGGM